MKDAGWVGKGVTGWHSRDPVPPSTAQAPQANEASAPQAVLYDPQGKPLVKERIVGFVKRR